MRTVSFSRASVSRLGPKLSVSPARSTRADTPSSARFAPSRQPLAQQRQQHRAQLAQLGGALGAVSLSPSPGGARGAAGPLAGGANAGTSWLSTSSTAVVSRRTSCRRPSRAAVPTSTPRASTRCLPSLACDQVGAKRQLGAGSARARAEHLRAGGVALPAHEQALHAQPRRPPSSALPPASLLPRSFRSNGSGSPLPRSDPPLAFTLPDQSPTETLSSFSWKSSPGDVTRTSRSHTLPQPEAHALHAAPRSHAPAPRARPCRALAPAPPTGQSPASRRHCRPPPMP